MLHCIRIFCGKGTGRGNTWYRFIASSVLVQYHHCLLLLLLSLLLLRSSWGCNEVLTHQSCKKGPVPETITSNFTKASKMYLLPFLRPFPNLSLLKNHIYTHTYIYSSLNTILIPELILYYILIIIIWLYFILYSHL